LFLGFEQDAVLLNALEAPAGPEIDDHDAAQQGGRIHASSVNANQLECGRRLADQWGRHGPRIAAETLKEDQADRQYQRRHEQPTQQLHSSGRSLEVCAGRKVGLAIQLACRVAAVERLSWRWDRCAGSRLPSPP
jgi:hypothetical protein